MGGEDDLVMRESEAVEDEEGAACVVARGVAVACGVLGEKLARGEDTPVSYPLYTPCVLLGRPEPVHKRYST